MYLLSFCTRCLVSQGSDDGHALAGANSEGDLAASENSVIIIFFVVRNDSLGSRRNPLGVTLYEDL